MLQDYAHFISAFWTEKNVLVRAASPHPLHAHIHKLHTAPCLLILKLHELQELLDFMRFRRNFLENLVISSGIIKKCPSRSFEKEKRRKLPH